MKINHVATKCMIVSNLTECDETSPKICTDFSAVSSTGYPMLNALHRHITVFNYLVRSQITCTVLYAVAAVQV